MDIGLRAATDQSVPGTCVTTAAPTPTPTPTPQPAIAPAPTRRATSRLSRSSTALSRKEKDRDKDRDRDRDREQEGDAQHADEGAKGTIASASFAADIGASVARAASSPLSQSSPTGSAIDPLSQVCNHLFCPQTPRARTRGAARLVVVCLSALAVLGRRNGHPSFMILRVTLRCILPSWWPGTGHWLRCQLR